MDTLLEPDGHPPRRRRAKSNGVRLTAKQAAVVKGMLVRGDRQSDIASTFQVNSGRISEVATGLRFPEVTSAPAADLPPQAPALPH